MSSINEIIEYAAEAFSQTNINEARAELARLQAIAEAAALMAESLRSFKYASTAWLGEPLIGIEPELLFDKYDKAALAAYVKAIKS